MKPVRYYRVDQVASDIRGSLQIDETIYIEVKKDSIGRTIYFIVEDLRTNGKGYISRYRMRKSVAESRINQKYFAQEE